MTANAFAISRHLAEAGMEKPVADAVAEQIVDYNDGRNATKADLAMAKSELKADIARIEAKLNIVIVLCGGMMVTWFGTILVFFINAAS